MDHQALNTLYNTIYQALLSITHLVSHSTPRRDPPRRFGRHDPPLWTVMQEISQEELHQEAAKVSLFESNPELFHRAFPGPQAENVHEDSVVSSDAEQEIDPPPPYDASPNFEADLSYQQIPTYAIFGITLIALAHLLVWFFV